MTLPDQLDRIGWAVPHFACRLGISVTLAYGWHRGRNTRGNPTQCPAPVLAWLERVAMAIERVTPPVG